jgi:hypothetical protein
MPYILGTMVSSGFEQARAQMGATRAMREVQGQVSPEAYKTAPDVEQFNPPQGPRQGPPAPAMAQPQGGPSPQEQRTTPGVSPTGAERRIRPAGTFPVGTDPVENVIRAKLAKGGPDPVLQTQLEDIQKNPRQETDAAHLAKQIHAARAGSLGTKQTSMNDPSAALAKQIEITKQATFNQKEQTATPAQSKPRAPRKSMIKGTQIRGIMDRLRNP